MKRSILCGIPLDAITMDAAMRWIFEAIDKGAPTYVVTPNLDFAEQCSRNTALLRILLRAGLVVCDGTPMVWFSKIFGAPLPERVAGSDLVPRLLGELEREGKSVFLLGGSEASLTRAVERVREKHPDLRLESFSPPYSDVETLIRNEDVDRRIRSARPDVLLIGLGCPKQEYLIAAKTRTWGVPVSIGVGGTIDFLAGTRLRAPGWIGLLGAEWIIRLVQEPRRLFLRYSADLVFLLEQVAKEIACRLGVFNATSRKTIPLSGKETVLSWKGELCQGGNGDFPEAPPLTPFVVDCSGITRVDFLGLAKISRMMDEAESQGLAHGVIHVPKKMRDRLQAANLDRIIPMMEPEETERESCSLEGEPLFSKISKERLIEIAVVVVTAAFTMMSGSSAATSDESVLSFFAFALILYLARPLTWIHRPEELRASSLLPPTLLYLAGCLTGVVLVQSIGWVWGAGYWASHRLRSTTLPLNRVFTTMFLALPWLVRDFPGIGWYFRISSAWTTEVVFRSLGFLVTREGTELTVGSLPVLIEPACAGLGLLQSLLATGSLLLAVYFPRGPLFYPLLVFLPVLSWLANTLRIVIITGIALTFGSKFATGVFHTGGGLIVIGLMAVLCLIPLELLRKITTKNP